MQAPWQAHPYEGRQIPPPDTPCDGCGSCACPVARAAGGCGAAPCGEPCEEKIDWCRFPDCFDPHGRLSFHGEYLAWWTKASNFPPLATTSPAGTTRTNAGVLGQPGTEVLFSGSDGDESGRSGARFTLNHWFSPCHEMGFDITYTFLGNTAGTFEQTSDASGSPIIARPFFNVNPATTRQDSSIIAYPDEQTGATIRNSLELNFLEVLLRRAVLQDCNRQLDFLIGYRYGRFAEGLSIDTTSTFISPVGEIPVGTVIQVSDQFDTGTSSTGPSWASWQIRTIAAGRWNCWQSSPWATPARE